MCIRDRYIAAANGYKSSLIDKLINKHRKKKVKKLDSDDLLPAKKCISAVSYTHLDVYKRQERERERE